VFCLQESGGMWDFVVGRGYDYYIIEQKGLIERFFQHSHSTTYVYSRAKFSAHASFLLADV